ncbi:MAG: YceD family protein [Vicinamibacterales bacterium]
MLLDLSRLRDGAEDHIARTWSASAFEGTEDFTVAEPVSFDAVVRRDKQAYRLVGRARTSLEMSCSRCTEPFRAPVDAAFDLRYFPHRENIGPARHDKHGEHEHEIEEDDLGTAFYRDETIDLGELVREQLYLALPMKPLCTEGCRGLCPQCGTNLNRGACDCRGAWQDPRLEGLRMFKKE